MDTLKLVVCLNLQVTMWSGSRRLTPADLSLPNGSLPPKEIASLGAIHLIDKNELSEFAALKKAAHRACQAWGTDFLGGFAGPNKNLADLTKRLEDLKSAFEQKKNELLSRYDAAVLKFAEEYPTWAHVIKSRAPTAAYIGQQLSFHYQVFQVVPSSQQEGGTVNSGLVAEAASLGDRLLRDVAKGAQEAWDNAFNGRARVKRESLRPVRSIVEKLTNLSFLNSNASMLAQRAQDVLKGLPGTGPIEGRDLDAINGLLLVMMDPARLISHSRGMFEPAEVEDAQAAAEIDDEVVVEDHGALAPATPAAPEASNWF